MPPQSIDIIGLTSCERLQLQGDTAAADVHWVCWIHRRKEKTLVWYCHRVYWKWIDTTNARAGRLETLARTRWYSTSLLVQTSPNDDDDDDDGNNNRPVAGARATDTSHCSVSRVARQLVRVSANGSRLFSRTEAHTTDCVQGMQADENVGHDEIGILWTKVVL